MRTACLDSVRRRRSTSRRLLYEQHKLISYPRTDSRYLSQDIAATLPRIVRTISDPYREHLAPGTGERP